MKRALIFIAAMLAVSGLAYGETIKGSAHDLADGTGSYDAGNVAGRLCVFCHTPHQADAANTQYPLWNHSLSSSGGYTVYTSTTLNANPLDFAAATAGSANTSQLCMSCHDGTVAIGTVWNEPYIKASDAEVTPNNGTLSGNALLGEDLTGEHPVNFTYDNALYVADGGASGGLYDPVATPAVAALLEDSRVQCTSCHEPHDNALGAYLIASNDNSALCLTCHNK